MKRDMELVRKIMLWCDDHERGSILELPRVDGYSDEAIGYHVYLLQDAGLITGVDATAMEHGSPHWYPNSITSQGHDFIAALPQGAPSRLESRVAPAGQSISSFRPSRVCGSPTGPVQNSSMR